jgi:hypothetical protein
MLGVMVPYALSVHSFVNKVGGYAGVAAVIAVALLVIMFFVNARETSALRDRATDAEERLYRLEYYAEQVNRNAAAQQAPVATQAEPGAAARDPATATGSSVAPVPAAAAAAIAAAGAPFAPVGVGAPALASATRLIPLAEVSAAREAHAAAAAAPVATATATALQDTQAHPMPPETNGAGTPPVALPPSTVAAGGQPSAPSADAPPQDPAPAPPPRLTPRPTPPVTAPRRNYGRPEEKSSRIGRASFAVAGLLVAVIVAAAVLIISHHHSGSGSGSASRSGHAHRTAAAGKHTRTSNSPSAKHTKTVRVNPSTVTVAVLNGTTTNNLAADVLQKLSTAGFQPGRTSNYPDQTQTTTTIGYLPSDRAKALAVASALDLSDKAVVKVSMTAREVVCSTPTACPDQVVVVVGADLASIA